MNLKYLSIIVSVFFLFAGCAADKQQIKKTEPPKACGEETLPVIKKAPDEKSDVPAKIEELKQALIANGVPGEWFDEQSRHETFRFHSDMDNFFQKSAEKQTDYDKIFDADWYFKHIGVEARIEKGKSFIKDHLELLKTAEAKHGIHKELIAAIIGIETNFADSHQRGYFYSFNSLVSQYIFTDRKNFAVREITALYKFSIKTGHPTEYFTSSYAGAIGWGQFIPSSLLAFFIDSNGINNDIDPFSIEDTIFSVENYFYHSGLSGENVKNYDGKYKAVFAYNHSDVYVKAVLYIYNGLRDYFSSPQPDVTTKTL